MASLLVSQPLLELSGFGPGLRGPDGRAWDDALLALTVAAAPASRVTSESASRVEPACQGTAAWHDGQVSNASSTCDPQEGQRGTRRIIAARAVH